MEQFNEAGAQTTGWKASLGAWLQAGAARMARGWRRAYGREGVQPLGHAGQIDGIVETLIFELGRSLDDLDASDDQPWNRTAGVLRLAMDRGASELDEEFQLLRVILEAEADASGATWPEKRRLWELIEVARMNALTELRFRAGNEGRPPRAKFGGVIVEMFGPRIRH